MPEAADILPCALLGAVLGAGHAAGLWWTVRRLASLRHPGAGLLISTGARTFAATVPIALVARGDAALLLAGVLALLIARAACMRIIMALPAAGGGGVP